MHQGLQSFVAKDLDILRSVYEVKDVCFRSTRDAIPVLKGAWWADATFSWFGKLHAFFAVLFSKLLGKPSIVVAGGDDVANQPDIGYGTFSYWWKKWCPLFVFRNADLILSVSESNARETVNNAEANPAKVRLLYHGFDPDRWRCNGDVPKENLVLTVGRVTDETLRKKGLKLFVEAARHLPDVPFVLAGPWADGAAEQLRAMAPSNVTLAGGVHGDDLVALYRRARVYVQCSVHESFGCAVAESMLCECLPVVSRRAALPEVVGGCGLYVDELTPEALADGIREALTLGPEWGKRARQRIIDLFPLERRRAQLLAAVDEVMNS